MWLENFLQRLTSTSSRRRSTRRRPPAARPCLEAIEDRCLPSTYTLVQIPLGPVDLNAHGQVVGRIGNGRAGIWEDGTLTDLGSLAGPSGRSSAHGINDAGQVVGWSEVAGGGGTAFLLTPEDADRDGAPDRWYRDDNQDGANDLMTPLPVNTAIDVNNSGQVAALQGNGRAAIWQAGALIDLGPIAVQGINNAGQVVGIFENFTALLTPEDTNGDGAADRWFRDADNDGANDLISKLGQWGYPYNSNRTAISSNGKVVGGDGYAHFLWTPSEANGASGDLEYLDNFAAGTFLTTAGVNASGQAIGVDEWSYGGEEGGFAGSMAVLWQNGRMYNLADLLPADSGWSSLYSAEAINDNGWIVGAATGASDTDGFIMIPTFGELPPLVNVSDASITEGNFGTTAVTFTVTLSNSWGQPVTVAYVTGDGAAAAGSDYQAASGTLTFAPGQTSKTITVLVNGDRLGEPNETFVINLSNPINATIADGQGVGTITDDEPRISTSDVAKAEGKKGKTTQFTFTVTLSAAYDQAVTLSFRTADGSAKTSDGDYVGKTGTLTFAPGETTKTITIEVKGDGKAEVNEYFFLDLFGNSGNSLFSKNRGTGTILNDD
jgi:probable HAF family extracellular repeat protein